MSIWTVIIEAISALRNGEGLSAVFDQLRRPPDKTVAFTIAVIGLGAKIAKADGLVTRNEVSAFREVFHIPPEDEAHAARVYDLARQDIAGFEEYARRISRMFNKDTGPLGDLLEGLFHIALADGDYHPGENDFLHRVAEIFGFDAQSFSRMRARFVPEAEQDPYSVLGVTPDMSPDAIRAVWRDLVKETHPDRLAARGVPVEAVKLAEKRLVDINRAMDLIMARSGKQGVSG